MALTVDTTKKYRNVPDGQNFTFSLSKPLNQLTAADLQSADFWVGFNCCSINQVYEGKGGEGIPENNPNYCNLWGTDPDWWYDQTNWASVHWSFPANQPNGIYMRNVYVNRDLNPGDYTVANSTARIVLEITPDENTTMQKLCMIDNSNYLQAEYNTSSYDSQMSDYTYISPAVLLVINNCVYLVNQNIQRFFVPDNIGFYINSTTDQGYQSYFPSFENLSYHKLAMGWTMGYTTGSIEDNCVKTGTGSAPIYTYNDVDFNGHIGKLQLSGGGSNYHIRISSTMSINADDSDFSLIHRAYSGVRFRVSGTWYKPIIQGGIVTGYTDDMSVSSEWDNWTKATGHNVPSGGGGGGASGDQEIDMPTNIYSVSAGMVTYYAMTDAEMLKLEDAFNTYNASIWNVGKDLMANIVSLKCFALTKTQLFSSSFNNIVHIGGVDMKDSSDNYVMGDTALVTKKIPLGSINIDETYHDYRDYSPYTKLEMYVPFCGWFSLPPWCMGRTITGELMVDIPNGTCKAVIKSGMTVVAEVGGCCAIDIPFTATATGAKTANIISNLASGAVAAFNPTPQHLVSASLGIMQAVNENYTNIKGVMGDGSNINGLDTVYVKITRPAPTEDGGISEQYKHERGIPCGKSIELAEGDGFTQVMDAQITGNMTAAEKQMIIDGFKHGLNL